MLRRAKEPKGLCINCAVHDWLRNTYPANVILAQSGPRVLVHPSVRDQFEQIMRSRHADAVPDEINWNLIVENWELPFPTPIKPSGTNPIRQRELDRIAANPDDSRDTRILGISRDLVIHSFEELNELEPGLGDELKEAIDGALGRPPTPPGAQTPAANRPDEEEPPEQQLELF